MAGAGILILEGLRLASSILAFVRRASETDEGLQAVVDAARAEGREVGVEDIKAAIAEMGAAADSLEAKLAAAAAGENGETNPSEPVAGSAKIGDG